MLSKLEGLCESIHTDNKYDFCTQKNQPFLIDFCICSSNRFVIGGDDQSRKKYKHYKSTVLCKTKTKKSSSSQVVENKE